jgi:hypothetical protein
MRGTDPRSGFSRADVDLSQRRGGELLLAPLSTLTDEAKRTGALKRGTPLSYGLTAGAFLGDLFNPSVDVPVAAGVKGVGAGVRAASDNVLRSMDPVDNLIKLDLDPAATARMLAVTNRLFHGKKGNTYEQSPQSFDVLPEAPRRGGNWFDGDFFTTPSKNLANTYGDLYNITSVPENLRVLDLMPGGRSIADQSPELASFLNRVFGPEEPTSFLTRHKPYTDAVLSNANDPPAVGSMNKILNDYGFNALRHISGQGAGRGSGLEEAVYVFFGPQGMQAVSQNGGPLLRSIDKAVEKISAPVTKAKQASQRTYQNALQDYNDADRISRKAFLENNPTPGLNPSDSMIGHFPMPPGYTPLPKPVEPGAFDFLKYLFAR